MDRSTELVRAGSEHRAPAPTRQRGHLTGADRRRCLATVCAIQFIGLLDTSMVSVALPSIGHGLHLAPAVLQWVLNAYTIVFSGFVLLGGRAADVFGQRRTLLAGLGMVAAGALASGGASSTGMLLAARAAQGLGAAIALPTAVSCLVTTFEEGAERNRAFSLYAASGCLAMVLGSLLGGFLTAQGGWRTVFVFTIALCAAGAALALLSPFED